MKHCLMIVLISQTTKFKSAYSNFNYIVMAFQYTDSSEQGLNLLISQSFVEQMRILQKTNHDVIGDLLCTSCLAFCLVNNYFDRC